MRLMVRPERVLRLATLVSLLLSLASAAMWSRSLFVTEGWEFKPRPSGEQLVIHSEGGRLVCAEYVGGSTTGYQRIDESTPRRQPNWGAVRPPLNTIRVPGVVEWNNFSTPPGNRPGGFVAVSWLAVAFAGAVLPVVRWWRRWQQRKRPANPGGFPVVASGNVFYQRLNPPCPSAEAPARGVSGRRDADCRFRIRRFVIGCPISNGGDTVGDTLGPLPPEVPAVAKLPAGPW
jgi:hypothetical protein